MPDSITPALTPEEWKDVNGRKKRPLSWAVGGSWAKQMAKENPAGAAAVMLNYVGYFAWKDVDALRAEARSLASDIESLEAAARVYGDNPARQEDVTSTRARATTLDEIADRLAALLPPRQGT